MDANDENPEFQNMPAITDVMEVSRGGSSSSITVGSVVLGPDGGFYSILFRQLRVEAASTKSRQWTRTQDQVVQSPTTFRYSSTMQMLVCTLDKSSWTGVMLGGLRLRTPGDSSSLYIQMDAKMDLEKLYGLIQPYWVFSFIDISICCACEWLVMW